MSNEKIGVEIMVKVGDWVEGDNGYGVVVKTFPEYYQHWDRDIPDGKKSGDKKQNSIILKRFCSYDFKVSLQTRLISERLVTPVPKKEIEKIKELLNDEKISSRFNKYIVKENQVEIVNLHQKLPVSKIKKIKEELGNMENNGQLSMTMPEIEEYLNKSFNIGDILTNPKQPNCYIQLATVGLGAYRGKELLFKEIGIQAL